MGQLDVTFTDDIPKIEREGFQRESKYAPLLNACVERSPKAAKITVESQGQASSRASSIKDAAMKHEAETEGRGLFVVATRSGDAEGEFNVYCKFVTTGTDEFKTEQAKREKAEAKGETEETGTEETETPPTPKPVKKAVKKATKKTA